MAMFTMDKVLRKPDYFDAVVRTNIHQTPLLAILKRGSKPTDWIQEVELEGPTISYDMAAAEGGVFDTSKLGKRVNGTMKHQLQKFRTIKGWSVTDEAEGMPSHTESKGEKTKAREIRKDAQELNLSIEHAISSEQEAVERGTADTGVARTRGIASWLTKFEKLSGDASDAAAAARIHPVQTIKPEYMPHYGFKGNVENMSTFNEEIFMEMLEGMADEQGDNHLMLTMLAGGKLKKLMSSWLYKVKATTGVDNAYRLNLAAGTKKKSLICDIFEYDSTTVRVIRDNHLFCSKQTIDGLSRFVHDDAAKLSGVLMRPECWSFDVFEDLKNVELPKQGDMTCGYHKMIARLACHNALAQGLVKHTAG